MAIKSGGNPACTVKLSFEGAICNVAHVTALAGRDQRQIRYQYYGNGLLRAISDLGIDSYSRFQYDQNGNRTLEAYSQALIEAGEGVDLHPYQLASAQYDELNRVRQVSDTAGKFDIRYSYDALGNRRSVASTYSEPLKQITQTQSFYYT